MAVTLYRQVGKGKARRYQKVNLGRGRRPAEDRFIPIPAKFAWKIKDRMRERNDQPHDMVFPNGNGKPDGRFLPRLKAIAKKAGIEAAELLPQDVRPWLALSSSGSWIRVQKSGIAKFALDMNGKSTTIWLWIVWAQHSRLCLIQPAAR